MAKYEKMVGPRVYQRGIRESDIDAVRDAMSDWRADGVQMTDQQATATITEWVSQMRRNTQNFLEASADPNNPDAFVLDPANVFERTWRYDGFFLNDTDECVGFQIGKFIGTEYHQRATMVRPSFRGQGLYTDAAKIGAKTLFLQIKNCTGLTTTIPVQQSEAQQAEMAKSVWVSDDLQISSFTNLDRIVPVTYSKQRVSKEQWLAWYNADAQADLRAEFYEYQIHDE